MKVITNGSKILLYAIGSGTASAKPEGPRRFLRFPAHNFTEEYYVGSNDGAICYVSNEDV